MNTKKPLLVAFRLDKETKAKYEKLLGVLGMKQQEFFEDYVKKMIKDFEID